LKALTLKALTLTALTLTALTLSPTRQCLPPKPTPSRTTRSSQPDAPRGADEHGFVRLRIDLAYDGTRFHGWAAQPGVRTVQEDVETALARVLRTAEAPQLTVAGRTDAGVHARGQVAHLDVPPQVWGTAAGTALRRLNRLLPPDVRVHAIGKVSADFDARFSALWRRYSYRISDGQAGADPLRRHDTLWHRWPVEVDLMNEAGASCLGEHDFAAFCRPRAGASTVRELFSLDWQRDEASVITGTIVADAFCHNMVRALAGALLAVGDGRKPVPWLARVLAAKVRDPAVAVAPAHPLCLEQVGYPADTDLAARALLTRRVRTRRPDPLSGNGSPR
jgi:tRNA pseudouridine38-40 synthase